jgi:hypothetical protein
MKMEKKEVKVLSDIVGELGKLSEGNSIKMLGYLELLKSGILHSNENQD